MESTQLVSIGFSVVTAALFGTVAIVLSRRAVSRELRGANNAFALWWGSISLSTLLSGCLLALAVSGFRELPFFVAASMVNVGLVCLALWGLLYYLLVLVADARRWAIPMGIAYAALAVYLGWYILQNDPTAVEVGRWAVQLQPRPSTTFQDFLVVGLVVGPQMVAALTYLSLFLRVPDRIAKARILIVGLSILLWFGAAAAGSLTAADSDLRHWASRIVGLVAASAILYAFLALTPRTGTEAVEGGPEVPANAPRPQEGPRRLVPLSFPS